VSRVRTRCKKTPVFQGVRSHDAMWFVIRSRRRVVRRVRARVRQVWRRVIFAFFALRVFQSRRCASRVARGSMKCSNSMHVGDGESIFSSIAICRRGVQRAMRRCVRYVRRRSFSGCSCSSFFVHFRTIGFFRSHTFAIAFVRAFDTCNYITVFRTSRKIFSILAIIFPCQSKKIFAEN
jgi:hypothetical protein